MSADVKIFLMKSMSWCAGKNKQKSVWDGAEIREYTDMNTVKDLQSQKLETDGNNQAHFPCQ